VDNVCHTLVGAAFGEAGLKRHTRYGNATLMIAANLPDVDVLVFFADVSAVSFRRGWTHGLPAQLLLPVAFTALVWLFDRVRARRDTSAPPLRIGAVLLLAYAGVYSHVLLDLLNTYGVRLLAPVDWRWFYGDAVFIIDPWLWLMLGGGVWLARRQARATPARGALLFAAGYILVMVLSARAARALVADLWRDTRGVEPRALMVGPVPINPFRRQVIVDAGDHYETGAFTWLPTAVTFDAEPVPKNANRPEVALARQSSTPIRAFLVWSRFPFWIITPRPGGTEVTAADMRFPDAAGAVDATFVGRTVLPPR
jgi:inner membrane protein